MEIWVETASDIATASGSTTAVLQPMRTAPMSRVEKKKTNFLYM
jgi:hypothetical protein